jgi:hypothetical protein
MKPLTTALNTIIFAGMAAAIAVLLISLEEEPARAPHGISPEVIVAPLMLLLATVAWCVSVPVALWSLAWRPELRTRTSIAVAVGGAVFLICSIIYFWRMVSL